MIESKEIKIGGEKFIINSLPATRAVSIAVRLAKVAGGAGMGISDFTMKIEELPEAFHLGNMVQGVLQNIDVDGAPELLRDIVRESVVFPQFEGEIDGVNADKRFLAWYDTRFSRKLDDLIALLYVIFSHNYGDPLEWLKKKWALAIELGLLAPSAPPSTKANMESEQAD